jgi:hypothetical protein
MKMTFKKTIAVLALLFGSGLSLLAQDLEERVRKLEERKTLVLAWPEWLEISGEWEYEYLDAQSDPNQDASANSHQRFAHDKFVLKPKITLGDHLYIKGELDFRTGGTLMEEYHATFTGLPLNSWIKIGLDERFMKANKSFDMADQKTETYPIIGTAHWRDEQNGITWGGLLKNFFWRLSFSDGLELNEKQVGENDSYEITHDNDQASDAVRHKKEWAYGLGLTFEISDDYTFDVAAWFIDSELNNDEKNRLNAINGYRIRDPYTAPAQINNSQKRWGLRSTHQIGQTNLLYELSHAEDAKLRRKGFYLQASHHISFDALFAGQYLKGVEALIRYEEYDVNLSPVYAQAETWDRQLWVYALLFDLYSHEKLKAKVKLEYLDSREHTGALNGRADQSRDPENDEFLAQLEIKF